MEQEDWNEICYKTNDNVIKVYNQSKKVIDEEIKEADYSIECVYKLSSNFGVFFRIEDIKNAAKYLRGGKRGPGKDNDFTIIDDCIFQFEIKKANKPSGHSVCKQFAGGKAWLEHLLPLISDSLSLHGYCIYNIYIFINNRSSLSRSGKATKPIYTPEKGYLTVTVPKSMAKLNLNKAIDEAYGRPCDYDSIPAVKQIEDFLSTNALSNKDLSELKYQIEDKLK